MIWQDGPNKVTNEHPNWFIYKGTATCDMTYVTRDDNRYWSVSVLYHINNKHKKSVTAYGSWSGPVTKEMTYGDTWLPNAEKTSVGWDYFKAYKDTTPLRIDY